MGRTVRGKAQLLAVQAGYDARQPLSIARTAAPSPSRRSRARPAHHLAGFAGQPPRRARHPTALCRSGAEALPRALGAVVEPISLGCPAATGLARPGSPGAVSGGRHAGPLGVIRKACAAQSPGAVGIRPGPDLTTAARQVYAASANRTLLPPHGRPVPAPRPAGCCPPRRSGPLPAEWTWPRDRRANARWTPTTAGWRWSSARHAGRPAGDQRAGGLQRRPWPADGHAADRPPLGDLAVLNATPPPEENRRLAGAPARRDGAA